MGRKEIPIDLKKVEEYAQVCDSEEEIALALGVSYATLKRRKRDWDLFAQALKRGRSKANIFVGGRLMQKIKDGDIAATIFYLKSRCGWKEARAVELTGKNGGAIETRSEVVDLTNAQKALLDKVLDEEF